MSPVLNVHLINGKKAGVNCLTEFVFQGKLKLGGENICQRETILLSLLCLDLGKKLPVS